MEFTIKKLQELLEIKPNNISKALKKSIYTRKNIEGSTKKVRHYCFEELPLRYQDRLKKLGVVDNNILKTNFSNVYLLANPTKQREAVLKCKLIDYYLKRDGSSNIKTWLKNIVKYNIEFDELGKITQKKLFDWLKKYKIAMASGNNLIESFIDLRGSKKGSILMSIQQQDMAIRYFLRSNRPMISEVHRNMCHEFGDSMCGYDALNNFYKNWKKENPILKEFANSPDSAKNKYLAAYGNMSAKARYRNHYWELDSTPADVVCDDGKRYTILSAIDVFSRRVVYLVSETSSAYSISQLLRKAILKFGIPDNVIIDNGKDYTSNHFESVCLNLGINMEIVPPFSGECKPHIERNFGTLSHELFEQIPGYIGHNVAQKLELQARKSFAHKIMSQEKWRNEHSQKSDEEKKAWSDAWKIKKENIGLQLNILLSADDLQMWCDNWANKIYEQRVHRGIKISPIKKWESEKEPVKSIADVRMLDLLLGESTLRKVGKKGISYDGCSYAHIELVEFSGQFVFVMAPKDLGKLLVYDKHMNFICIAEDLENMGRDRYAVKNSRKKSLALFRKMDKIVKEAEKIGISDVSIMDRINDISVKKTKTVAVMKHTEAVDRLIKTNEIIVQQDKKDLEKSIKYDFQNKDDEGKPKKLLPNGRPPFESLYSKFIWLLKNPENWNEKDDRSKYKNIKIYELAKKDFEDKKVG